MAATMNPTFELVNDPIEGPAARLPIGNTELSVREVLWRADSQFPESREVRVDVDAEPVALSLEAAAELPSAFRRFADEVAAVLARAGEVGRTVPAPRRWTELVHGGVTVGGTDERIWCEGHPEPKYPQHIQDVAHMSKQIGVTAQCVDGPLGVLMAYITERPFDSETMIGNGAKLLLTPDEQHETRALDLAGARRLAVDIRTWLVEFEALVEQMGTEAPGAADG